MENWILWLTAAVVINLASFGFVAFKRPLWDLDSQVWWGAFTVVNVLMTTMSLIYFWDDLFQMDSRVLIVIVSVMASVFVVLSYLIVKEDYEEFLKENIKAFHLSDVQNDKMSGYLLLKETLEQPKAKAVSFEDYGSLEDDNGAYAEAKYKVGHDYPVKLISASIWDGIYVEFAENNY